MLLISPWAGHITRYHPVALASEMLVTMRAIIQNVAILPPDHEAPGWSVCSWTMGALLPAVREVDWTAGAACGAGTQSEAGGGKGTLQLLLHPVTCIVTTYTRSVLSYSTMILIVASQSPMLMRTVCVRDWLVVCCMTSQCLSENVC